MIEFKRRWIIEATFLNDSLTDFEYVKLYETDTCHTGFLDSVDWLAKPFNDRVALDGTGLENLMRVEYWYSSPDIVEKLAVVWPHKRKALKQ